MKIIVLLTALSAFGLMGAMGGCEGKAPVVHMCKSYATEDACVADSTCYWQDADPSQPDAVQKCKAR